MNAAFFLTQHQLEHQRKQQLKEQKRQLTLKKKKCEKKLKNLTVKDDVKLRSIMSQLYCTVALQVELLDELEECFYLSKMPLFQEFSEKFIKLNNELYNISVKNEEDDISRQEWEKMMKNIICKMPELNIKQLPLLENFIANLKNKK